MSLWWPNLKIKSSKTSSNKPIKERKAVFCITRSRRYLSSWSRNLAAKPRNPHLLRVRNCSKMCSLTMMKMTRWECTMSACLTARKEQKSTRLSPCAWFVTLPHVATINSLISGSKLLPLQEQPRTKTKRLSSTRAPTRMRLARNHKRIRCLWSVK